MQYSPIVSTMVRGQYPHNPAPGHGLRAGPVVGTYNNPQFKHQWHIHPDTSIASVRQLPNGHLETYITRNLSPVSPHIQRGMITSIRKPDIPGHTTTSDVFLNSKDDSHVHELEDLKKAHDQQKSDADKWFREHGKKSNELQALEEKTEIELASLREKIAEERETFRLANQISSFHQSKFKKATELHVKLRNENIAKDSAILKHEQNSVLHIGEIERLRGVQTKFTEYTKKIEIKLKEIGTLEQDLEKAKNHLAEKESHTLFQVFNHISTADLTHYLSKATQLEYEKKLEIAIEKKIKQNTDNTAADRILWFDIKGIKKDLHSILTLTADKKVIDSTKAVNKKKIDDINKKIEGLRRNIKAAKSFDAIKDFLSDYHEYFSPTETPEIEPSRAIGFRGLFMGRNAPPPPPPRPSLP